MKKSEIKVGNHYIARVSNRLTTVRVDEMGMSEPWAGYRRARQYYHCTNLSTGRKVTFKSASKFRKEADVGDQFQSGIERTSNQIEKALSAGWLDQPKDILAEQAEDMARVTKPPTGERR